MEQWINHKGDHNNVQTMEAEALPAAGGLCSLRTCSSSWSKSATLAHDDLPIDADKQSIVDIAAGA
jgi:hypothetical protein